MNKQTNIHDLYNQLGATVADILAHNDCPPVIYNELGQMMINIDNKTPGTARQIALARGSFVEFLSALTARPTAPERKQKARRS